MNAVRLLPSQVPQLWNAIKFASMSTDRVSENNVGAHLNKLLHSLLSDKSQCFIRFDENRQLIGLMITRIQDDEMLGERTLFITCLFSYKVIDEEQWRQEFSLLTNFARKNKCTKISTLSNNPRVFEIAGYVGFTESYRCLSLEI